MSLSQCRSPRNVALRQKSPFRSAYVDFYHFDNLPFTLKNCVMAAYVVYKFLILQINFSQYLNRQSS